jgi:hypothetical protein
MSSLKDQKHQVLYGFEHETMEAKIESFLKLTPEQRYLQTRNPKQFQKKTNSNVQNNRHQTFRE